MRTFILSTAASMMAIMPFAATASSYHSAEWYVNTLQLDQRVADGSIVADVTRSHAGVGGVTPQLQRAIDTNLKEIRRLVRCVEQPNTCKNSMER